MRTSLCLLLVAGLLVVLAVPAGAAPVESDEQARVTGLIGKLGLDDLARKILGGADDNGQEAGLGGDATVTPQSSKVGAVWTPIDALAEGILQLGLQLIAGFFFGVAEGAESLGAAMATIGAYPAESAAIAAVAFSLLALLSALVAAAHRYGGIGLVPLFSRIAKSNLLEHKLRADVFEVIKANPGINVSEIARRLDVAWGTVTHHLQKLRAERLVAIRVEGHQKCYFPNGGAFTPREMEVMGVVKSPNAHRIAEYLIRSGPASHGELSDSLSLSPALVSFHVQKLVAAGVVARERQGRSTLYTPLERILSPEARASRHEI